jgi:glycosyltransferase involved in cell wall biosynthesis
MKIAVVSKADAAGGGASRVAEELAFHLRSKGHQAVHFAAWAGSFGDHRHALYGGRIARKATLLAHKAARKIGFAESIPFELPAAVSHFADFDLVHFHDTSSAISPLTLWQIARSKPVVWTFHDCSPFTGGCIYPQMGSCERYKTGCGDCPLTHEWPLDGTLDTTSWALLLRRSLHKQPNLHAVVPSEWMRDLAWESGNLQSMPTVISNMVDSETLKPFDDIDGVRRRLGVPPGRLVLTASSGNINDARKGIRETLDAARRLSELKPLVVLLGAPDRHLHEHAEGIEFLSTGYVHDRAHLREWLSASDSFLFTSKADNQPLSILESFACGTPVYGFSTGGAVEMIIDGVSGRLIPGRDVAELSRRIQDDWHSGAMAAMRQSSRERAVGRYGPEPFVMKHIELYEAAIKKQAN